MKIVLKVEWAHNYWLFFLSSKGFLVAVVRATANFCLAIESPQRFSTKHFMLLLNNLAEAIWRFFPLLQQADNIVSGRKRKGNYNEWRGWCPHFLWILLCYCARFGRNMKYLCISACIVAHLTYDCINGILRCSVSVIVVLLSVTCQCEVVRPQFSHLKNKQVFFR